MNPQRHRLIGHLITKENIKETAKAVVEEAKAL
jgi:hypothetical protein